MAEIISVYKQALPKMRFVGKCYTEADRENGTFAHKWGEWWQNGWFDALEVGGDEPFDDAGAPIGLCRMKEGEPFEYWIGMFLPEDFTAPEGFGTIDFDVGEIAVCLVKGTEPEIYFEDCTGKLAENGYKMRPDKNGVYWCFERYACPRYTDPDADGNVILDQCFFV